MNQHHYTRIDSKLTIPEVSRPTLTGEPLTLQTAIKRYLDGESIQTLAQETGNTRRTIYSWMLTGLGDDQYHDLVTQCLVARVSDADSELDNATNPLHIARARETARFARMDLERRRPGLYGQKQEITHKQQAPTLNITIINNPPEQPVLEGEKVVIPEPSK